MPLRFRIPWGLLLAVLGFAGLGAAFGYLLLTDFHGHLVRRCALHAAGAGLLGAAAWRLSDRLADLVNLHTSPFVRLALSGSAAIWIATQALGVFTELAVGGGALWAEGIAVLLFVIAGAVPLLAGIVLVGGLETMLAARRGGGRVIEAIRPMAVHVLAAALALVATVYVATMFPAAPVHAAIALAPDRVRASGWSEREKRLFAAVHAGWSCDVLVVPVEGAAPSLDRAARSLITRMIAAGLAGRSGLCVADPTLVARAVGARERTADDRAVMLLADAMRARFLVRGDVRREEQRAAFSVSLRLWQRAGPQAAWAEGEKTVWGPLPFSDDLPPEAVFAHVAREAVEALGIPLESDEDGPPALEEPGKLPATMAQLVDYAHTPLARARALQLLAAAHHPAELGGEHLWERSVVALLVLPAEHPQARALRARAALHLQRRPYALQLLDGLDATEARALRALADGNVVEAARLSAELDDVAGLTLDFELAALRARYGKQSAARERSAVLLQTWPGYAPLLNVALKAAVPPAPEVHAAIARELASLGAQVARPPLASLAAKLAIELPGEQAAAALAGDVERSYAPLWRTQAAVWRNERAFDRLAAWDVPDALYAANRAAVLTRLRTLSSTPTNEEALTGLVRALGSPFTGHAGIEAALAVALQRMSATGGELGFLLAERSRRLQYEVLAWEGGESDTERELRARLDIAQPPPADEPPRAWRAPAERAQNAGEQASANQSLPITRASHFARMQSYSQDAFEVLQRAIELHERVGQPDRAAQLLEQARTRFTGSPARERFLLQRAEAARDLNAAVVLLQERIREQPEQWAAYPLLARAYLRAQEPAMAQRALLAYPPFNGAPGKEELRRASEAGALLLMAGEGDFARPLLELATQPGQDAGASARLAAAMALAQLDGDWPQARKLALDLHERDAAQHTLARASTLAFLLGEPEAGWRAFYEASKRFEDLSPWAAAVDGHRLQGTRSDEIVAFAKRWKSLSGEGARETRLKSQFLFNMLLVDRPSADWVVEALTGFGEKREDPGFAALVRGYAAFKRGDYPVAVEQLEPTQQTGAAEPAVLPWLALALSQTGRAADAEAMLQAAKQKPAAGFHATLATAYLAGAKGETEVALHKLWDAFLLAPPLLHNVVPAGFQVLEACERLHALTGDERYRQLLLDLARRQQRAWPVSWAFAFEARHATHLDDRERALGVALFLDPESEHLREFPPQQRQRAAERFAHSNPFRRG